MLSNSRAWFGAAQMLFRGFGGQVCLGEPRPWRTAICGCVWALASVAAIAKGAVIQLKDGRQLEGAVVLLGGLADNPLKNMNPEAAGDQRILMLDNQLTRTFVPKARAAAINEAGGERFEKIDVRQTVAIAGARIGHVGDIIKVTPWDEFGRRTFSMNSEIGQLDVIQGITAITPHWTRVEGLNEQAAVRLGLPPCDQFHPRDVLQKVLSRQTDPKNFEERTRLVRLFLQAERFGDAQAEMAGIVRDFPDRQDLAPLVKELRQRDARRILDEIELAASWASRVWLAACSRSFPRRTWPAKRCKRSPKASPNSRRSQKKGAELLKATRPTRRRDPRLVAAAAGASRV